MFLCLFKLTLLASAGLSASLGEAGVLEGLRCTLALFATKSDAEITVNSPPNALFLIFVPALTLYCVPVLIVVSVPTVKS